ncbi:MAG: cadherin domain-containing protein [Allosphingosinicella sp.]
MPSFVRSGAAFAANSQIASAQNRSSITSLADGGFVVVWQTMDNSADGSWWAIKSQRFNAQGVAVGGEILVNTLGAGDQTGAKVTSLASGGYVVTWETSDSAQDGSGTAIKARLFDSAGLPVGGEFRVNSLASQDQKEPTVTGLADGGFVVAWYTTDTAQDGAGWAIKGQRFSAEGIAVGAEFRVNSTAFGSQYNIDIASLSSGGFVVTWQTGNSSGTQVSAQMYDSDGAKLGAELTVSNGFSSHTFGRVAGLANGGFVVTWMTDIGGGLGICAQVFNAAGAKVGAALFVNSGTFGVYPDVAALPDGTFLITWEGRDGGIKGQSYSATGQRLGGEYTVVDAADATETGVAVAALANGNLVVGWTHKVTGASSGDDIRLQMLRPNTAPELGADTRALAVAENNQNVATVAAADSDGPSGITYSIAGGADALRFTINASTGLLRFVSNPNFEAPADGGGDNVYQVIVRASDGDLTDVQTISVTVTNVNEAPAISSNGGGATASISVGEGALAVTTVTALDVDSPVTYSISGGADAARFLIDGATGALSFATNPDFEQPADADGNNVYLVTVRASDGQLADTQALSITVADVNERPIITSNGGGTSAVVQLDEGQTAVTQVIASDPDGPNPLTYSITGGFNADLFTIDAVTGGLLFIDAPAYVAGADNVYSVTVTASDGELSSFQSIQIAIRDVNHVTIVSDGGLDDVQLSIDENQTHVTNVSAVDEDGLPLTYSITGGEDAALFTIDAQTGALSFTAGPDYEQPEDWYGDNRYKVEVTASDGTASDSQGMIIIVNDLAVEGFSITSDGGGDSATVAVAENGTAVTMVAAGGPGAVTYSIVGGADAADFTIDSTTGALAFASAPDFEGTADVDHDNVYEVIVRAGNGLSSDDQHLFVNLTDVDDVPYFFDLEEDAVDAWIIENREYVGEMMAFDPDGGPAITYAITGGIDASSFLIDPNTGTLSFLAAQRPDFEAPVDAGADNVYDLEITASQGSWSSARAFTVTVVNENERPAITSNGGGASASIEMDEGQTAVTNVAASDDGPNPVTYSITGGPAADLFAIDAATGALSFIAAPDYEAPAGGSDNFYTVHVAASDGELSSFQMVQILVRDIEEGVTITTGPALSVDEDSAFVTRVTATDGDGDPLSYTIVGGADSSHFAIDAATGDLTIRASLDFEAPADADGDNVYEVTVRATDGQFSDERQMSISVNDVFDDVEIVSYGGADSVSLTMLESSSFQVADVDASFSPFWGVRFAIAGGADASLFTVDPYDGELSFNYPFTPNSEAPGDADGDNVYDVVVVATLGTGSDTQAFAITVANRNEGLWITSDGSGDADLILDEGDSNVTTVTAFDMDGDVPVYSIVGGTDAALFAIDPATGVLTFIAAPDHEAPHNGSGTNFYTVEVGASDGEFTDTQRIRIQIGNVNERPAFTSGGGGETVAVTVNENGLAVTSLAASDPDSNPLTYSIAGGADASRFTIDAWSGVLRFVQAPNFEAPGDAGGNNVYDVVVSVTDGLLTDSQAVAVTVANLAEIVTITSNGGGASGSVAVSENGVTVATVAASNPDGGGAVTYAIAGGADAARFTIDASTGLLAFVAAPNFEAPADAGADNVYDVVVSAANGATLDTQALAVTVGNVNEPMAIASNGGGASAAVSVNENATVVTTVVGVDPDGGPVTYVILDGGDSGLFTIDATTGVLAFRAAPDFEAPGDVDGDNVYDVVVMASDGHWSDTQAIAVTVGNVAEAPVIASGGGGASGSASVAENSVAVAVVAATDPDGGTVTYSIAGGADAARFTINAETGALQFVAAPDWELPTDSNQDNVYAVVVRAGDGQLFDDQALNVSVTNTRDGNNVTGTSGGDSISATSTNVALRTSHEEDVVHGRDGHDNIQGMAGDDDLYGEAGNDVLTGGAGADRLTGGLGKDQFSYTALADSAGASRDLIMDFSRAQADKISLSAIDANSVAGGNQAFTFIGASAFSNAPGQLRYETSAGMTTIWGDVNGDGLADLQIQLAGSIALVASDFVL